MLSLRIALDEARVTHDRTDGPRAASGNSRRGADLASVEKVVVRLALRFDR